MLSFHHAYFESLLRGIIASQYPTVVLLGQTGAGKSSLFNALAGNYLSATSAVAACTRQPKSHTLYADSPINLIDMPGLGESLIRDEEYQAMYAEQIKTARLIVWVVKADSRSLRIDAEAFATLVRPAIRNKNVRVVVVLSQAEKIEPCREWNESKNQPGINQRHHLKRRIAQVAEQFELGEDCVIPVSVHESWQGKMLMQHIRKAASLTSL